jgi:hypothetical protein
MLTPTGIRIINYVQGVRRPITYKELAAHLGMLEFQVGSPLRPIRRACRKLKLPRLDALFVDENGLSGDQFNENGVPLTPEQHQQLVDEVWEYGLDRVCHALLAA